MMKKTLLSIMTMAALVNSATATAAVETKNITVNAEIPHEITMKKSNGEDIKKIELVPDNNSPTTYGAKESIVIASHGQDVKINLIEDFKLVSTTESGNSFTDLTVTMDGTELATTPQKIGNKVSNIAKELTIVGKAPSTSKGGEKYTGVLKLNLEPVT